MQNPLTKLAQVAVGIGASQVQAMIEATGLKSPEGGMNSSVICAKAARADRTVMRAITCVCLVGAQAFAQNGTFTATGIMSTPRVYHTSTFLPNGKVLIVGGMGGYVYGGGGFRTIYPTITELYDPVTGVFYPTASSGIKVSSTATVLHNGKVLIAGGGTSGAELYDPATGAFSYAGSMTVLRSGHSATVLPDGKVLIAGGQMSTISSFGGFVESAEQYDPATGAFSPTGRMSDRRGSHTATLLPNGTVLVVGGYYLNNNYRHPILAWASAELYDPATGAFTRTGPMITARGNHTATLLPNGKVLITGGYTTVPVDPPPPSIGYTAFIPLASAELYDPASGTFSETGSMTAPRVYHTATMLPNGKVLALGARQPSCDFSAPDVYDPVTGTFRATGAMIQARMAPTATLLGNGEVLVAGGWNEACDSPNTVLATAELYDPFLGVAIAVKPGEGNNTINSKSNATVLVAILSSADFDATTVDPASVTLAGAHVVTQGKAGTPLTNIQDVNRDGRLDLLLHYRTPDLQLAPDATEAVLLGETFSGQSIRGTDSIRLVP